MTRRIWPAYAAAVWAAIFAVFHFVWAAGWPIGLTEETARIAFAKPIFLAYDLFIAFLCVLAVPVALAMVQPWGQRVPRWLVGSLAWAGTGLLVIRGGGSIVQTLYLLVVGRFTPEPMMLWEPWFYLGAVLFLVTTWRYWRAGRSRAAL